MIQKTIDFNNPAEVQRELKRQAELMMPSFGHAPSPVLDSVLHAMASVIAMQNVAMDEYIKKSYQNLAKAVGLDPNDLQIDEHGNIVVKLKDPIEFVPISITIGDVSVSDCSHVWAEYFGFNDSFVYCKKCDKKKS